MDENFFLISEAESGAYSAKIESEKIECERKIPKISSWRELNFRAWRKFSAAIDLKWIESEMEKRGVKNYTFIIRISSEDGIHPLYSFREKNFDFKISVGSECTKIVVCGENGRDGNYIKEFDGRKLKSIKMQRNIEILQNQVRDLQTQLYDFRNSYYLHIDRNTPVRKDKFL